MMRLALVVAFAAATPSLIRWMRVSQREHYLPMSAIVSARRWLKHRPPNSVVALAWAALLGVSVVTFTSAPGWSAVIGFAAAAIGVMFPLGMSIMGSPRLRLTRRATFQAALATTIAGLTVLVCALTLAPGVAAGLSPAIGLLSVDLAALANRPLERRIVAKYRRMADGTLRRVRPRVVAITGSYGKTTVKNHIRHLVSDAYDTVATPASWNNMAGLCRAINEHLAATTEVFVAEMGTYGLGEIREMVEWLRPEVAVITAIGPVHLERMKTLETIAAAKSEILSGARVAVVCVDDALLLDVAERAKRDAQAAEVWMVGSDSAHPNLDVFVCESPQIGGDGEPAPMLSVYVRGERIGELAADSLHPRNVACAVASALALGVSGEVLRRALAKLGPTESRAALGTTDTGIIVLDDTFNSNPAGAAAALSTLTRVVPEGRRVVITPGMVEMGHLQYDANMHFAKQIAAANTDLVIVGWTNRAPLAAGHPDAIAVSNRDAAGRWVRENLGHGDGVLWENDLPDHYP